MEGKGLRARAPEFAKHNVQILGASFDTVADNAAFARKYDFDFPLLSDPDRSLALAFGAAQSADASHAKRVSALIGADGRVRKLYPKVEPAAHPAEVLADLEGGVAD